MEGSRDERSASGLTPRPHFVTEGGATRPAAKLLGLHVAEPTVRIELEYVSIVCADSKVQARDPVAEPGRMFFIAIRCRDQGKKEGERNDQASLGSSRAVSRAL
ncbi:MAG: hypothetical protein VCB99_01170 [Myxococcota bacterium]